MQGAGPGTLLGGRYSLRRRLLKARDLERWTAHDTTLERDVTLTIIDSDHANRAAILDAARRAAGVEDSRLVRILDVGTQEGNSFIVEEAMSGAESLAAILSQGALPAEEARRIAGETARGLETAGQRGLHHLRLTPHSIMLAPDGAVRVSGVAVAAAIDGPDEQEPDSAAASRRDTVSIVAVTYAALTTRWPLDEGVSGVKPAPLVAGGVAAPSEIGAGVPGDLDALCQLMLNEDTGPLTPGDLASQIAPWSREPVHRDWVEPTVVLHLPTANQVGADQVGADQVGAEVPVSTGGTEPTVAISTRDIPTRSPSTRPAEEAPEAHGSEPLADPTVGDRAVAAGATAGKAVGAALASAGAAAGVVGSKVGSFARAAADKATASTAQADADAGGEQMTLPEALSGTVNEVGPPLPMLPASTAQRLSGGQSKVVIMIVITFVGLALLAAFFGIRDVGKGISLPDGTPQRTVTVSAPPVTVPAAPAPPTGASATGTVAILSATGFDPEGDKSEKNGQAARVYDGDTSTTWTSEGYNSADFGRLKKGVGVLLDLGQPTSVKQVTVNLGNGPVDVTVYAATEASLEGAVVIGEASAASGQIRLKAASSTPLAQHVIVWFTRVAPDGGLFRASISEIALT